MASDVVRIICPNLRCKAILSVPSTARGKTVRCRQCGARVGVPAAPVITERPAVTAEADATAGAPATPAAGADHATKA